MANGMFGATAGGGFLGRSMVNIQAGGSTRLSPVVCALTVFLVVVVLGRYLAWVPASGMAGLVMAVGVLLVDRWSLRLAAKLFSAKVANRREILTNLGIVVLVMAVAVYRDIMAAAGTGVALSVLVFVGQMGQSVVRRNYGGDKVRSLKRRAGELQRLLTEHGRAIQVFELMGPVFFGSTDGLIDMVDDRVDRGARWIILDMRYVTRMDATGANVLAQTAGRLDRQGVRLLISSTSRDSMTCQMMRDMGLDESLCVDRVFESTDEALEWCEDELLVSLGMSPEGEPLLEARVLLERLGFDEEHSLALAGYLVREEYEVGETVCRMGESGDSMYFIAQGLVDVLLVLEGGRRKRVHTLATGTVFGEMSLLEGTPRSADILVRERMVCYSMDQAGLDRMVANQPQTAVSLLSFLARTVAGNLRHSNEMISELEK
jgi:SulP family sulfate permease